MFIKNSDDLFVIWMSEKNDKEYKRDHGAHKAVSETLLELVERSEGWFSQRTRWDTGSAYLTMIFCLIGGLALIAGAYISHTYESSLAAAVSMGIGIFTQLFVVIWWLFFLHHSRNAVKEKDVWLHKHIRPIVNHDTSILFKNYEDK